MTHRDKSAISLGISALIVIVIILIVGFGFFLNSTFNTNSTSTTSPPGIMIINSTNSTSPTAAASTAFYSESQKSVNSSSGLRLDLLVAPSNGTAGTLVISVDEFNTLNTTNNVTFANEWSFPKQYLNPYDGCGLLGPLGIGIFQGFYDLNNYTKASALTLYNTTTAFTCITTINVPNAFYSIKANSDQATTIYPSSNFVNQNTTLSISFSAKGYWTAGFGTGSSAAFHSFPQGNYTVLAADEWGKVVMVHFEVSSSGFSSGTSIFTSGSLTAQSASNPNTSDELVCVSTNYQVLGRESISVQNGTTYTSNVTTFTTSTQTTFTTTTTESQTIGYGTTTTSYNPPSSWTVVSCTYAGTK